MGNGLATAFCSNEGKKQFGRAPAPKLGEYGPEIDSVKVRGYMPLIPTSALLEALEEEFLCCWLLSPPICVTPRALFAAYFTSCQYVGFALEPSSSCETSLRLHHRAVELLSLLDTAKQEKEEEPGRESEEIERCESAATVCAFTARAYALREAFFELTGLTEEEVQNGLKKQPIYTKLEADEALLKLDGVASTALQFEDNVLHKKGLTDAGESYVLGKPRPGALSQSYTKTTQSTGKTSSNLYPELLLDLLYRGMFHYLGKEVRFYDVDVFQLAPVDDKVLKREEETRRNKQEKDLYLKYLRNPYVLER